jgi:ATP-dependent helicase/nuclease subunit B
VQPLISRSFRGATLTESDEVACTAGSVGCPSWGPLALLSDLELRLGLPQPRVNHALRVQLWSQRMARLSNAGRFYSASYQIDPLGTAKTLLSWRDELVEAGWDGGPIADGGPRLEQLSELEAASDLVVPPGLGDRLAMAGRELGRIDQAVYRRLEHADPLEVWPGRWRSVFARLAELGAVVVRRAASDPSLAGACDLRHVQRALLGVRDPDARIVGDGSLVVLTGTTTWELAAAVADLLAEDGAGGNAVVIRGADVQVLDAALVRRGVATLGSATASLWRGPLQVLPLALELSYEPRDPYRLLEMLTLPGGPFAGRIGGRLAQAVAESPGIGGPAWIAAKAALREQVSAERARAVALRLAGDDGAAESAETRAGRWDRRLSRAEAWLETRGHDRGDGAPRGDLVVMADRIRTWLGGMRALATTDSVVAAAHAQATDFARSLATAREDHLPLLASRRLLDSIASNGSPAVALFAEEQGRVDHVGGPGGLRVERDLVLWWSCVDGQESPPRSPPWRATERRALEAAGIMLADAGAELEETAAGWRRAILAARNRLVLVFPSSIAGERTAPHPVWDEIVASAGLTTTDETMLRRDVAQIIAERGVVYAPLPLPPSRAAWRSSRSLWSTPPRHSATSLETLLKCELRWVLSRRVRLRSGALAAIPAAHLLNGTLGHRLLQELHAAGALTGDATQVERAASERIVTLLEQEGSTLLRPGMSFEHFDVRRQLLAAARAFAQLLRDGAFEVVEMERPLTGTLDDGILEGRPDVVLRGPDGRRVIVDLKWGASRHVERLRKGLALQLALYAHLLRDPGAPTPLAAYFALRRGRAFSTDPKAFPGAQAVDGPALDTTLTRTRRSLEESRVELVDGQVRVGAFAPRAEDESKVRYDEEETCEYCVFGAICGRSWRDFR